MGFKLNEHFEKLMKWLVVFLFLCIFSDARRFPLFGRPVSKTRSTSSFPIPNATVIYYTQALDHFNQKSTSATYQQRILHYDGYWGRGTSMSWKTPNCPGPIFFYTGNESPVTDYWSNSGFMFLLAQKHGARVIFAEHRYFGESMPFGNNSFNGDKVGYLSPEQALADYAQYLTDVNTQACPVISFGGSYGGMLTAWFRMKYPNIVYGGLAASAPFAFYGTGVSEYAYMDAAQDSYRQAGPGCDVQLGQVIQLMVKLSASSEGLGMMSKTFPTCTPLQSEQDGLNLLQWVQNALIYMVELNYDEASNYGIQFPAWPVNRTCSDLNSLFSINPLKAIAFAIQNYYNSTGDKTCVDINLDQPDFAFSPGWDYLACTETYMPMGQRGIWYPYQPPSLPGDESACMQQWNITMRPNWSRIHWGGFSSFEAASNIIFSNGLIDPWHALGVLVSPNPANSAVAIVIPASAHHGDLRGPSPNDPVYLKNARVQEENVIIQWLKTFYATRAHQ